MYVEVSKVVGLYKTLYAYKIQILNNFEEIISNLSWTMIRDNNNNITNNINFYNLTNYTHTKYNV